MENKEFKAAFDEVFKEFIQEREYVPKDEFIEFLGQIRNVIVNNVADEDQQIPITQFIDLMVRSIEASPGEMFSPEIFNFN